MESIKPEPGKPSRRPEYLVLFAEDADVDAVLGIPASQGYSIRSGAGPRILQPDPEGAITVFDDLGIAAGDFDRRTRERLQHSDAVEQIVPNELRGIPPFLVEESSLVPSSRPALAALEPPPYIEDDAANARASNRTWCLDLIGGPSRFDGAGVVVAVLDTGVDATHPDLEHLFPGGTGMESFVGGTAHDGNGHGTHCIGVIASRAQPRIGPRYGVAPGVTLLSGKVFADDGTGTDDQILAGIQWAAAGGAHIISMSLGGPRTVGTPFPPVYERIGKRLGDRGVLLVAAAGNSSRRQHTGHAAPIENPAACPSFKAVAALDRRCDIAPFSCGAVDGDHGRIAIAAPGVAVHSAWPGGGYKMLSGTSMAVPHVAGAAALWRQHLGRNAWSAIATAARRLVPVGDFGDGLVQVP